MAWSASAYAWHGKPAVRGVRSAMTWTCIFKPVADKLSIAEEAYDYAVRSASSPSGGSAFTWTCPACQQLITDRGPYPDPPRQEEGHADGCVRWAARLREWKIRMSSGNG